MGFSILYKRLFRLQLLHGYFLNHGNRLENFEPSNNERFKLSQVLEFMPLLKSDRILQGHRMRMIEESNGICCVIRVTEKSANGNTSFAPLVPLESPTLLSFGIKIKDPNWSNYTNLRLSPNLPSIFYFSNFAPGGMDQSPNLGLGILDYQTGRAYEMGELVQTDTSVFIATRTVNQDSPPGEESGPNWEKIQLLSDENRNKYASYKDRVLLPSKFRYSFSPLEGVLIKEGSFSLINSENTEVAKIDFNEEQPITSYSVDFSDVNTGWYTLKVTSTSGYKDQKLIYMNDELYDPSLFGVIEIAHQTGLGDLKILEDNGNLLSDESGNHSFPTFKILLKNRYTYWQYVLFKGQSITLPSVAEVKFYEPSNNRRLVTKKPQPMTFTFTEILLQSDDPQTGDINEKILLPNPSNLLVYRDENGQLYSEIFLPKIKI